ncbi:DUF5057 domain-containing protein [Paenibacillus tengchongensis]|uniref:DUF5057 domain-containing protein n=1 Tax=Paenibacillus tengchongensis TaxID=2608684 RepID=UPI001651F95F|nr:DUF5057 domain-containing protein [Paenibacillus tengchongensis]
MKMFKRRKFILLSGAAASVLLILLLVQLFSPNVEASNNYPIRILEITDPTNSNLGTDGSELDELKKLPNVTIETMTMKKFVSLREDWDGKYDAVYIGSGEYTPKAVSTNGNSSTDVRTEAHNTKTVENDITLLKAKELTEYYINKGLYVFFREETFSAQAASSAKQGNLYKSFNVFRSASGSKANVVFLNASGFNNLAPEIKSGTSPYLSGLTQRPRITISNKSNIKSYLSSPNYTYTAGDQLNFSINLSNTPNISTHPIRVKLYMNVDSSLHMTESNMVATEVLSTQTGTLSYTLPATYSGPLYWKLEISDNATGLKDFDSGVIRFRGLKPVIKVLQVMPAGKTGSSLKSTSNMKTQYLSSNDYEIQIEVHDMAWFNDYISKKASSTDKTSGLNGVYNMVVFGFQDEYDRISNPMISRDAALAVKAFAEETKQSIMLTHDTIYNDPTNPKTENYTNKVPNINYWSYYFHDLVGQGMPRTYLGGSAVATSRTVVPMNNGLLTQYPFNLETVELPPNQSRYAVALTHDQFFPLNLERADVIPWYNISGNERDINDSRNHFYTYSVGNITFSGTGHTSTNFPDWEQMLFVNTMYRAFVGANHAPEITVKMPTDNQEKPSYQDKLTVSYTVTDPDLKDKDLVTNIKFKVDNQVLPGYTVKDKAIVSGETVTQTFTNPLPNGGTLQIEITARDAHGAETPKIVTVPIRKIYPNLGISRSLSEIEVRRDEPVDIQYSITPNNVPYLQVESADRGIDTLVISNVKFEETFPANLEISTNSGNFTKTGSLEQGYTISRDFGTITYRLSTVNGTKTYVPTSTDPITFTLTAVPKVKQSYTLDNSKLSYQDIHSLSTGGTFPGSSAPVNALGIANDYSLFMLGSANFQNSSFTNRGRMAAGGAINIRSFTMGGGLGTNPTGATIVAGGNLTMDGGTIYGKAYYGGTVSAPDYLLSKAERGTPIDFNAVGSQLKNRSLELAQIASNGSTTRENNGNLIFRGTHSDLNIFSVDATYTRDIRSLIFDVPASSSVVVNVKGTEANLGNGQITLGNLQASNLLFNFYQTTTMSVNYHLYGTYLAPLAAIRFGGDLDGSIIGNTITGNGGGYSVNLIPLTTVIPDTTLPERETQTLYFSPLGFEAIVKITSITLTPADILVGSELRMLPIIVPEDASNTNLHWVSDNPSVVTVDQEGVIKGIVSGEATITATSRDDTNKSGSALIKVISPNLQIEGPAKGYVGDAISLKAIYTTAMESVTGYSWSIKDGSNSAGASFKIDLTAEHDNKIVLQAANSGRATLVIKALTDKKPGGAFTTEHTVTFTNPVQTIRIGDANSVKVGDFIDLKVYVLQPTNNPDPAEYTWSLADGDNKFAEIIRGATSDSIKLKGVAIASSVTVMVTTKGRDDQTVTATTTIAVGSKLTGLNLRESLEIGVGSQHAHSLFNEKDLSVFPVTMTLADVIGKLEWRSSNEALATVSQNGLVTGIKKGTATITVIYKDNPAISDTMQVNVSNDDKY